ncbi:sigma factor [soil metagenome]
MPSPVTDASTAGLPESSRFATTAWSLVLQSRDRGEFARPALELLCRIYWRPLYAYAHRRFGTPHLAEDAVQSFFTSLLESDLLAQADPQRGRFRNYLLACFSQSMARQNRHERAAKRYPGTPVIPLDAIEHELDDRTLSPETAFDRAWALTLLERAVNRLKSEFTADGREVRFQAMRGMLNSTSVTDGGELARQLNLSDGAARVALHRFRQRYAEIVREEVRGTIEHDADLEAEIRDLMAAFA